MIAQTADPISDGAVSGSDRARIAKRAQILARVKAEAGNLPEAPNAASVISGSVCLRCIFDQQDVPAGTDFRNGLQIYWTTVEMHGNDRAGP